jgi:Chitobiase/beta-hexosaminidase C-terminal domain/Fn3 associated
MLHGNRPRRGETVKYREQSYLPGTPVSAASGSLGAAIIPFRETRRSRLLVVLALAVMTLGILIPSYGQETSIFDCPSGFTSSGLCGTNGSGGNFRLIGNYNSLSGSQISLIVANSETHVSSTVNYTTLTDDQAFDAVFRFVPNGQNIAFYLQNNNNNPGYDGADFVGGAGCEGGFFQAFPAGAAPNNVFALELDSYSPLTQNGSFTYSSAQIYQMNQSPCLPNDSGPNYWPTNKISTSPVPLDAPTNSQGTTTGDTYQATITYTGTTLTLQLYDVTANGSCPGSSCFTYTWPYISIPAMVDGTQAYPGISAAIGTVVGNHPLYLDSFVYSALSAAATPTFSPSAGTYASTQSVTISDETSSSYICYNFTGEPATNGIGGCANGTLYSGAISVPSGRKLYAVAGVAEASGDSAVGSATYNITGTGSIPTFNQPGGTFQGNQTVQLTAAQGTVICYNTAGSPATNGATGCTTGTQYSTPITVSSNETIYAVAGGTGFTDSSVGSATYTINPFANGGTAPANAPTYSPVPETYPGTQQVTISTTTSGGYICYTLASSLPSLPPQPNNEGGCITGTLYSGPVTISSSETLYAITGTANKSNPSSLVQGAYTIGTSTAGQTPAPPTNVQGSAVPSP